MATEKRLIDANEAKVIFDERYDVAFMQSHTRPNIAWWEGYSAGVNWARNTINDAPTVDAMEVVRCKDCLWAATPYGDEDDGFIECTNIPGRPLFRDESFCSYGERKDNV